MSCSFDYVSNDQLALKTVNGARSAFASFIFQQSFFHSYRDVRRVSGQDLEEETEEEPLKCKISIKVRFVYCRPSNRFRVFDADTLTLCSHVYLYSKLCPLLRRQWIGVASILTLSRTSWCLSFTAGMVRMVPLYYIPLLLPCCHSPLICNAVTARYSEDA